MPLGIKTSWVFIPIFLIILFLIPNQWVNYIHLQQAMIFHWTMFLGLFKFLTCNHFCSIARVMSRKRNALVATGLLTFVSVALAFPFYMGSRAPLIDSSKPLPPQATFRGPYINTGSRDIGPDQPTYPKK